MSVADRLTLAAFIAANPRPKQVEFVSRRAAFDALCERFPVPPEAEVVAAHVGAVPGEWIYTAQCRRDAVLLFLHGGAYAIGSPRSHRHLAVALGQASGLSVFSADYRLAPEHPFPAAVDDALAIYAELLESGFVPQRIALAGDSAGGGLAIATLVAARERGLPMSACVVTMSAWADLTQSAESHRTRALRDPTIVTESLNVMAAAYLSGVDAKNPLASPAFADLRGLPPMLLQVGTEEVLYDDTLRLGASAMKAGVEVSQEIWGGMIHAWHLFHPMLSEGRDAIARVGSYLRAHVE